MPTFDITRPKDIIRLDVDRRGAIPFTVTNVTTKTIRTRLEAMPLVPADQAYLTVEGGAERSTRPGETFNLRVLVAAPADAAPGSHKFWLKVVDVDSPDDNYAESQSVEFHIPDSKPVRPPLPFPWWLIPAVALLAVVIGVVAWYLHGHPKLDDYTKMKMDDAKSSLKEKDLTIKIVPNTTAENPTDEDIIVGQSFAGKPAPAGTRVKRGGEVSLEVAQAIPTIGNFRTKKVDDAVFELRKKGLTVTVLTNRIVLSGDEDRLVIEQTIGGQPTIDGQRAKHGTEITLEASGQMPRLVDHTLAEARSQLAAKGFPQEIKVNAEPILAAERWDKVFRQEPDPGPPPNPGSGVIQLWVHVKPESVPMPNLMANGMKYCAALRELSSRGLNAKEVIFPVASFFPLELNLIVRGQEPAADTPVLKGDTVVVKHSGASIPSISCFTRHIVRPHN